MFWNTSEVYSAGSNGTYVTIRASIDILPLFVRVGAVVPLLPLNTVRLRHPGHFPPIRPGLGCVDMVKARISQSCLRTSTACGVDVCEYTRVYGTGVGGEEGLVTSAVWHK